MRTRIFPLAALLLLAGSLAPTQAAAQSELDTAQAQAFLGNWNVSLQSEMGPLPLTLAIRDVDGKVGVEFGSDMGSQEVTNVTRSGEDLVLTFVTDAQGQAIDIVINLRRDGEQLRANVLAMGGAFTATGTATRAD